MLKQTQQCFERCHICQNFSIGSKKEWLAYSCVCTYHLGLRSNQYCGTVYSSQKWFFSNVIVRQIYPSPSILGNIQWLDNSAGHSLNSTYNPTSTVWSSSPFSKTSLHPHTSPPMYPNSTTSSFTSPKDGFTSPSRDGKESPRLQEVMKAERLSPMGGGGSSFLNLTSPTGGMYGHSPHMLGPYGSYMATSPDYSSAALYSPTGPWMNPNYSPKLRNKMRLSPPGKFFLPRYIFSQYIFQTLLFEQFLILNVNYISF